MLIPQCKLKKIFFFGSVQGYTETYISYIVVVRVYGGEFISYVLSKDMS